MNKRSRAMARKHKTLTYRQAFIDGFTEAGNGLLNFIYVMSVISAFMLLMAWVVVPGFKIIVSIVEAIN